MTEVKDTRRTEYRTIWGTQVSVSTISQMAKTSAEYHKEHADLWDQDVNDLEAEYKESVQVREQPITGGTTMTVAADQEVGQALSEARRKLGYHRTEQRKYVAWATFLGHFPAQQTLEITVADIEYFMLPAEAVWAGWEHGDRRAE